ncbi:hypothetical protein [Burkholderia sp. LMG 13014]|uniref:hypothetical protein n=1 Tax=Burkholderia sp. LMG 13014 TaxID=2709306 RepID=UPI00196588D0|nr:hypothetical protein [Burkholderia sp. LMG 13014]
MTAAGELPASPQAAHDARFDCLDAPVPHGAARVRAYLVDRIKRAAIRKLHRSAHGERWVLRMYLIGEEATECALHEDWTGQPPDWLAQRIGERGVAPSTEPHEPDWLSRRKIMRWRRLAQRHAPHFAQGVLVPAYATGLCAEQMAMRVLARHCETIGDAHPLYPLLSRVLADETRHVRLCADTLRRLVAPSEAAHLAVLLNEIRAIEAGFGVTGALAMVAAGWIQSLRPRA